MSAMASKTRRILRIGGALAVAILSFVVYWHMAERSVSRNLSGTDLAREEQWNSLGGQWVADSAEVRNSSEERGAKFIAHAGEWKDFQISGDLQISEPFGEAGVILRSSGEQEGVDAYHGYFAGIRTMDSSVEIGRADFGWRPLSHVLFHAAADPQGWFHFHVVAVGCKVALQVRSPGGEVASTLIGEDDCIQSGGFGLRSSYSSAKWKNLRVSTANQADLAAVGANAMQAAGAGDLLLSEPTAQSDVQRYTASLREEAVKHQTQPGITPISSLRYFPGRHPNVTVQGNVISLPPLLDIQDNTSTIIIPDVDPKIPLKLGDFVEAHGTLVSERFRSRLEDATIRLLWSDLPTPPLAVTAAQLTAGTYRGRFIEIEGTLISIHHQTDGDELVLKDGDQIFRALGQVDLRLHAASLKPGSRLRLRGNATALDQFTNGIYPFTVITDQVTVISAPPWWSPAHILWLVLASFVLLGCVQWVIHCVQAWHVRSLLREREELAFEMHDTLAQSFTGISYQLQAATMETRGVREMQAHVQNALRMVDLSHREASRTIAALRPQNRQASDIVAALRELAERLSYGAGLIVEAHTDGKDVELPLALTDALFRIGQEAVTNAVQHAGCTIVEIRLQLSREQVTFTVQDDGKGFSLQGQTHGLGIAGMKSRAAKVNARFTVAPAASGGTCITVAAPLLHSQGLLSELRALLTTVFTRRYLH